MSRGTKSPHGIHEDFEREETTTGSSDRAFGVVIGTVLGLIGLWPLLRVSPPRTWAVVASAVIVALALARPSLLAPLNRLWTRLGLMLHRIVSPVVLGLVFYTTLTPLALIARVLGKDLLRLRFDRSLPSYWIVRVPPGPAPDTMRRQF